MNDVSASKIIEIEKWMNILNQKITTAKDSVTVAEGSIVKNEAQIRNITEKLAGRLLKLK